MTSMMNMKYMTSMKYMKWVKKFYVYIGVNKHINCLYLHKLYHYNFGFRSARSERNDHKNIATHGI